MEWLVSGFFALSVFVGSVIYLVSKLLRLKPLVAPFQIQLKLLATASERVPELAKLASALGDDPVAHLGRRIELQRKARGERRARSRRLIARIR